MRLVRLFLGFITALIALLWRATIRFRVVDDPRPALRAAGQPYAYAILHAHQVAAVFAGDDRIQAMVSRSGDGDFLVPLLYLRHVRPVRGSTRKRGVDKGGRAALGGLSAGVRNGVPALIAVDGPRGPRNYVHRGIADLAVETGATILPAVVLPSSRWILSRAWDRFQIPRPFCTISLIFGTPIRTAGRDAEALRDEVGEALRALERRLDPVEAELAQPRIN